MSGYDYSLALMVPDALREKGNLLACALGHDQLPGNTFSVEVSTSGGYPATHYACHSWVQSSFIELLAQVGQGELPAEIDWIEFGLTQPEVWETFAAMRLSTPSTTPLDFDAWLASLNLKRVVPEDV